MLISTVLTEQNKVMSELALREGLRSRVNSGFQRVSFDLEPIFIPDLTEVSRRARRISRPMLSTYVPGILVFDPPTLRISRQDILYATETEFLDDVLSEYTVEEREQVRLGLSSWVDEKLEESGLELTEESKVHFVNVMALIMKKVSEMLHDSEG